MNIYATILVYTANSDDEPESYNGIMVSDITIIEYPINRTKVYCGYVDSHAIGLFHKYAPSMVFCECHINSNFVPQTFELYYDR